MSLRNCRSIFCAAALATLMTAPKAAADDITILARCGASDGQSYYFEGGIVGPGQGGYTKDGVDGGRVTVYINEKGQLDLLVKDRINIKSYLKAGYQVALVHFDPTTRSMLISTRGVDFVETYLIKLNEVGVGTMVWTLGKITPSIIKTSTMVAPCGPAFEIKP